MPALPEIVVADAASLAEFCEHINRFEVVGLDTEFIGEQSYIPDLCLIQVSTPERLALVDPLACGPLEAFWRCIVDPARQVVVHSGREEIRLCHFACEQTPAQIFDLQLAAGLTGRGYPLGYGPLIQDLLGTKLAKGETLTDWRRRPLTDQQVRYAFDDVRFLLPMFVSLQNRLQELNRLDWLREETELLKHRAVVDNPTIEKWRKLRGVGALDRRRLAIVRELFAWREEKAARANRPPRTILRDDLIIELSRRNPRSEDEVRAVRGMGRTDAASILAAMQRARALPADEWPEIQERENDPPQVALLTGLLQAILADVCSRLELSSSLAATTQDLKWLVRARLMDEALLEESHLSHGWRRHHLLPDLLAFLDGKRGIRAGDLRSERPLVYFDISASVE